MPIEVIIFKPPLENPTQEDLLRIIELGSCQRLAIPSDGSSLDITPDGYRDKYEVSAFTQPGAPDSIGKITITRRGGRVVSAINIAGGNAVLKESDQNRVSYLINEGNPLVLIARPLSLNDPRKQGIQVDGLVMYIPTRSVRRN